MKGAILYNHGVPKYVEDYPDPVATSEEMVVVKVVASTIKNLDVGKASGKHYLIYKEFPTTVGVDGVIQLDDGTLAYAMGVSGMIAEKAVVVKGKWVVLEKDTDPLMAAALPNCILGAAMAINVRGKIKQGDVVLVNGATGFTGKAAVQLARLAGASYVVATGRNVQILEQMKKELGIDEYIVLSDDDDQVTQQFKQLFAKKPVDLVIDYIWGKPAELLLNTLASTGQYKVTRVVTVGEMAGSSIALKSATLRSTAIEIVGSGFGSFAPGEIQQYLANHLNPLLALVKQGKLILDTQTIQLSQIEQYWGKNNDSRKRIVINIQ